METDLSGQALKRKRGVRVIAEEAGLVLLALVFLALCFLVLSGLGWGVTQATVLFGGKPEMWALLNAFDIPNQPTLAGIAIGFLVAVIGTLALCIFVLQLLSSFGAWLLSMLR